MKDVNDKQTADLLPVPARRGRPVTGNALSSAEKQAAYRKRLAENTVTVTFNKDDFEQLKTLMAYHASYPDDALIDDVAVVERICDVLWGMKGISAAAEAMRDKEQGR